jgi:signal transduction histidine kinase
MDPMVISLKVIRHSLTFFYVYLVLALVCSLSVTLLPQRLAKVKNVKLENELALKKTFVRYISHELRTPLSIALSGMALLEDRVKEGAPMAEVLSVVEDIRQPCLTSVDILNDLLDFEKLDSGLTVLDAECQDPCDFFESSVGLFRAMAQQKQIELTVVSTVINDTAVVRIDKPKLSQVLRNLLSNALKFTPRDGSVVVTAVIDDKHFKVTVKDSGVGISAENQLRLFGEGVQFHANAHQGGGGSGLGLWISKKIVELHGGSIGAQSEGEGTGTLFFFSIPLQDEGTRRGLPIGDSSSGLRNESTQNEPLLGRPVPVSCVSDTPGCLFPPDLNVLIVDDSALNRKMMINRLAKLKCVTAQADDGDCGSPRGRGLSLVTQQYCNEVIKSDTFDPM